jgi:type IX secretion system PorP/SprF family membrane protein
MNRFLPAVIFSAVFLNVFAQTEPQFTQYMYNKYLYNTACSGSKDGIEASLLFRDQYVNLSNQAIATEGFNVNLPIEKASSGIGITVINDMIGYQRSTYASLNYDYRKNFSWGKMGVGIGAGIIETALNGAELTAPDGTYGNGVVNHNDPYLPNTLQNAVAPDISAGIYFNNDKYFAGASLQHIAFASAKIHGTVAATDLNFARNLCFMGGYDFKISKKVSIMPNALVKTDFKLVQTDIGATLTIIDNILTGISFRGYTTNTIDALSLIFGFRYKGAQLVYSYDANLSYLTNFNSGTHEISFSYYYGFKKKESKGYLYHNPRYD